MLILAIVCTAWLEIIGIQSAKKEARRREAVERLSGIMDAFMYIYRKGGAVAGNYRVKTEDYHMEVLNEVSFEPDPNANIVRPVFKGEISPIGYQLQVIRYDGDVISGVGGLPEMNLFVGFSGWNVPWYADHSFWLVGRLYDKNGMPDEFCKVFFTLPVYLGPEIE